MASSSLSRICLACLSGQSDGVRWVPEERLGPSPSHAPGSMQLHLALQEAADSVEIGIVVIADDDLQPADADLSIHGVQQGRVAFGQAHHHICGVVGRSGLSRSHTPSPGYPVDCGTHPGATGIHLAAGPETVLSGRSSTWRCQWHWLKLLLAPGALQSTAGRGSLQAGLGWTPETGLAQPVVGLWH